MTAPELEFFNKLSGKLEIELTKPAGRVADLLNLQADPDAQVLTLKLKAEVFDEDTETARELTPAEYDGIAFHGSRIRLRGESGETVDHDAPNGSHFTVRQLLQAVEETERQTRDQSEWLGGVDVHHCYFEGIAPDEEDDETWEIYWGS